MAEKMNYLKNKKVYLSGPIEFGTKHNWREKPIEYLKNKLFLDVFDPFSDPKAQWGIKIKNAKKEKDYKKIINIAKSFVRRDLAMVDRSDLLIAYMPYNVQTVGTVHEIVNGVNSKKPTLIICPEGKEKIPVWIWGIVKEEFLFGSWEKVYSYLKEVSVGKHAKNNTWHFCDWN